MVFAGFGVDPDSVADIDEGGHLDNEARLGAGGLDLRAGGRAFDARHSVFDAQIDGEDGDDEDPTDDLA